MPAARTNKVGFINMLLVNDCAKVRNKYYKVRISSKKMLELFFFGRFVRFMSRLLLATEFFNKRKK